jgi:CRISPR-associated protein (TIGR03984 family)
MRATLFSWAAAGVTLGETLVAAAPCLCDGGEATFALLYAPTRAHLCLVSEMGDLMSSSGSPIDPDDVFEARCFSLNGELRWLHEQDGRGPAVYVSEADLDEAGRQVFETRLDPLECEVLEQTYVLFGKGAPDESLAPGWSRAAEARVGAIDVPLAGVAEGEHVGLRFREYIGPQPEDEHGNWVVLEERFLGLEIARGEAS